MCVLISACLAAELVLTRRETSTEVRSETVNTSDPSSTSSQLQWMRITPLLSYLRISSPATALLSSDSLVLWQLRPAVLLLNRVVAYHYLVAVDHSAACRPCRDGELVHSCHINSFCPSTPTYQHS